MSDPNRLANCEGPAASRPIEAEDHKHLISIAGTSVTFQAEKSESLLFAMLRSGLGAPYECSSGGCGSCKFTLLEGTLDQEIENPGGLRPADIRKNKHLACITKARSDCVIDLKLDTAYEPITRPRRTTARFHHQRQITHDLWEFYFQTDEAADFLPGQYARLHIPGAPGPRSYSMSNTANDDGIWSFMIKRVPKGQATTILFTQNLTDMEIAIDAPFSIAHLDSGSSRPVICIAGGSGLAPVVSVLRGIAEATGRADRPILYYGARTSIDVVPQDIFSDIQGFDVSRQYIPIVSETRSDDGWTGPTGFLHEHLVDALGENCVDCDYYIAGPPPMVEAVRRHLVLNCQVPIDQLHYDRFF